MHKEIKTPWGAIFPQVSLFPILYLLFIYGFVYILPYGRDLIGMSWFDWLLRNLNEKYFSCDWWGRLCWF